MFYPFITLVCHLPTDEWLTRHWSLGMARAGVCVIIQLCHFDPCSYSRVKIVDVRLSKVEVEYFSLI
jgi:hypothetical protein